jgi:hypothetical protein
MGESIDAGRPCGLGNGPRPECLNGVESLLAGGRQYSDRVDDRIGSLKSPVNGPAVPQICLNGQDLTRSTERLKVAGQIRAADRGPHTVTAPCQSLNNMPAQETGAAEYSDEFAVKGCGHPENAFCRVQKLFPAKDMLEISPRLLDLCAQCVKGWP